MTVFIFLLCIRFWNRYALGIFNSINFYKNWKNNINYRKREKVEEIREKEKLWRNKQKRKATWPNHTMLCYLSHYKTIRYCYFYFILWHFFHVINFIDYDFTCYVNTVLLILLFDLYLHLFILLIMKPSSFPFDLLVLNHHPFPESSRLLLRIIFMSAVMSMYLRVALI